MDEDNAASLRHVIYVLSRGSRILPGALNLRPNLRMKVSECSSDS